MTLFTSLLPLYLLGNVHCASMCGPLVALIGKHPYRVLYFVGRLLSFSLAGLLAAEMGLVLHAVLQKRHLGAYTAFGFGGFVALFGLAMLFNIKGPLTPFLAKKMAPIAQKLALLVHTKAPWPTFLFGFFTILLPCGQTIVVFSALALSSHPLVGLFNGFAFALLTSPSLFFAMHFGKKVRQSAPILMGLFTFFIGILLTLRGLAELEVLPHAVISSKFHIVLF